MEGMNLQEFVRTTLVQLMKGVQEALDETATLAGAAVNPRGTRAQSTEATEVRFDVAVTVTSSTDGSGKAHLAIAGIEIGGGGAKHSHNEAVSRIQFGVPVSLPSAELDLYKPGSEPKRRVVAGYGS